jgi:hypothetical protein
MLSSGMAAGGLDGVDRVTAAIASYSPWENSAADTYIILQMMPKSKVFSITLASPEEVI